MLDSLTLERIFHSFEEQDPRPQCALVYTNAYTLLVAVVLSAQSTDKGVNKIMPALMEKADTPQRMLDLGEASLKGLIQTVGLYQRKAAYVIELSRQLLERHAGQVPDSREALMALSGVGRKTANVVLNVFFGHPTVPVDTHVFRVARRLGLSQGSTPEKVEQDLETSLPPQWRGRAHQWLIHHGRTLCRARLPLCKACPLNQMCLFYQSLKV